MMMITSESNIVETVKKHIGKLTSKSTNIDIEEVFIREIENAKYCESYVMTLCEEKEMELKLESLKLRTSV